MRSAQLLCSIDIPFQQLRPGHDPMATVHRGEDISRHRIGQNDHSAILELERAAQPGGEDQLFHQALIGAISDRPFKPRSDRIRQRLILSAHVKEAGEGIGKQQMWIQGGVRCGRRHQLRLPLQLRNAPGEQLHPLVIHQTKQIFRACGEGAQARCIKNVHITPAQPLEQNDVAEILPGPDRGQSSDLTPMGPTTAQSENASGYGDGYWPQTPVHIHASAVDPNAQGKGIASGAGDASFQRRNGFILRDHHFAESKGERATTALEHELQQSIFEIVVVFAGRTIQHHREGSRRQRPNFGCGENVVIVDVEPTFTQTWLNQQCAHQSNHNGEPGRQQRPVAGWVGRCWLCHGMIHQIPSKVIAT